MIQLEKIVTGLESQVIFEQTEDPDYAPLASDLVDTSTGARLCYHPLIRSENIDAIAPNYDNMNWPAWIAQAYTAGTTVKHLGTHWTASADTLAGDIPGTSILWVEKDRLSDYLRRRRKEAIRHVVMDSYNSKRMKNKQREELDNIMLYEGGGSMDLKVIKKGRIVGFSIELLNNLGLEVVLAQLSLQLDTIQPLNLYLWHQNQEDPIDIIPINQTVANSVEWHDLGNKLKFRDLENNLDNGFYYLGYYEDDLIGQAIRKRFTFGVTPCSTCSRYNSKAYNRYSQYVKFRAFSVAPGNIPASNKLWDVRNITYNADTNWGMNLRISSGCDISDWVLDRPHVFADSIAEQLKFDIIQEIAHNTRSNNLSEITKQNARGVLQAEHLGGEGLTKRLENSKESANIEMSDIQRNVCMPREKVKGVTSSTVSVRGNTLRGRSVY